MNMPFAIVVASCSHEQQDIFRKAWGIYDDPDWLFMEYATDGCSRTKNRGIMRAIDSGAQVVCVIDDDCAPSECVTLEEHAYKHIECLRDTEVNLFLPIAGPPHSRGTPYTSLTVKMPVAASMGFWTNVPDLDAARELANYGTASIPWTRKPVFGQYFPLCGMNFAFKAQEFPWCQLVNVTRFDDTICGWLWQKKAYTHSQCFNLGGPLVRHTRASNVFKNIKVEAQNMEMCESLWKQIALGPLLGYKEMLENYHLTLT